MTPAFAELLEQLRERLRLDVASRDALWDRYWREKARWTAEGKGKDMESPASRVVPILEKAMNQKSVGSVLAIVRQALEVLHEDESSRSLG